MLNISGTRVVEDVNFRYKMPRMIAKTEGRGNGIKTVIVNMSDIATALNRPPELVTKFFGVDLGAQSKYDEVGDKCTVNGAHTTPDLQKLLNIFIDKFVLCPNCHLPESALVVKKGFIFSKCSACGAKEPADMAHKLCVFILRTAEIELQRVRDAEEKALKDKKDKKAAAAAGAIGPDGEKVKKEKKPKKAAKSSLVTAAAAAAAAGADEDDEGAGGGAGGAGGDADDGDDSGEEEGLSAAAAVAAKRASVAAKEASASAAAAAASAGAGAGAGALQGALEALLAAPKDGARAAAVGAAAKAAGAKQADIFAALGAAALSGGEALPLLKAVPVALNALYDADVVTEGACTAWHSGSVGDARVKAKAKPFIDWLAEADDEDEEEEEEGGE
jgi:translation initiation factor 5